MAIKVDVTWKKGIYSLTANDTFINTIKVKKGSNDITRIKVQYNATFIGKNVEAYRLVPLVVTRKGKQYIYTFTDETMVTSVYRPVEISTSINETTKAIYNLNGSGHFALYDPKAMVVFCVYVE